MTMQPRLCIIADDLTGALDAAAPFAGRGLHTHVALSPAALPQALATGAAVIAVTTASRETSAAHATTAIAAVLAALPPEMRIFKKIDSRMKGHIGAELAALAPQTLLVAPAIPDFGRLVQAGHVTGFGVEVPINILPILGAAGRHALIPEVIDPAQMQEALAAAPQDALLVGAKGLAEALAIQMTGQRHATPARAQGAHALIAVGSHDPITLAQVDALRRTGRADWRAAPNGTLPNVAAAPLSALTLVQATPGADRISGAEVARALTASLHPALTAQADLLFVTGGATAEAVFDGMGLTDMALIGECFPGVPLARAGKLSIITKSGGFGGPGLLVELADQLGGQA